MRSYDPIRSVARSMQVLTAMNRQPVSRIQDLQSETGLAAATLVRILETLCGLGYVQQQGRRSGYILTEKTLELSAGYHGFPAYIDQVTPVLKSLTERILWPVALATLEGHSMIVRISTIPESPLSHVHSTLQKRLDLLTRAHGRAYLAFCPDAERTRLIDLLCKLEISHMTPEDLELHIEPTLARIRQTGYAERDHAIDPQTTTIAMPVMKAQEVAATIGITFFKGAKPDRASLLQELLSVVQEAESRITGNGEPDC